MTAWLPPPGTAGDVSFIRVGLTVIREDDRDCPTATAVKTRPWVRPDPEPPRRYEKLQSFTLKPLMDALDLIEHRRQTVPQVMEQLRRTKATFGLRGRPLAHPGLVEWTAAAVTRYLAAREADQVVREAAGAMRTYFVPEEWVVRRELGSPDRRGATHYEQTAWGRRYVSLDGRIRELRVLSFGTAKEDRPEAEKAAAAYTTAFGIPCEPAFNQLHRPAVDLPVARTLRPQRVRVIDVGCGDGSATVLVDWDLDEVQRRYAQAAAPAMARVVEATARLSGSSCVDCKALAGCTELHRAPGLLGIAAPARTRRRRSVSASDLRVHSQCPAQHHLTRELNLKSLLPENAAILRGRAVDAWLNEQHHARPDDGCRYAPGPPNPDNWSAGDHSLIGDEARLGAQMIAQHALLCPLDGLGRSEKVRVQPQLSCYDPELDVVVIATPDLLHTRAGGWIWREVKTMTSYLWEGKTLLRNYPQLALAVLMMASGVLGGDPRRSRIELEMLYPDDSGFEELDPGLASVVDEARDVIADLAGPWYQDASYEPAPGRYCGGCEALEWCSPGREHLAATREPTARAR